MKRIALVIALGLITFFGKANLTTTLNVTANSSELNVDVNIDDVADSVTLTITGPEDKYFAVGFGNDVMFDSYTIVCNQTGVQVEERMLGNHNAGTVLTSTLTVLSSAVSNGQLTLVVRRALTGPTAEYFDFSNVMAGAGVNTIYAIGFSQGLSYHGATGRGVTSLMFADNLTATSEVDFKTTIAMYPNPASTHLNVEFGKVTSATELKVMTQQGQIVQTKNCEAANELTLSMEALEAGSYYLLIKNTEHEAMFHFVKE